MAPHIPSDDARRHLDEGRHALLEMLERFALQHGMSDPDGLAFMRAAAEQAHDVRAGLRGARGFEQARDLTSSRITLVDDAELEFGLELERFTRDVKEATEAGLAHLHLRYLSLLSADAEAFNETPVGPETVCSALSALVDSQVLAPDERSQLLEAWRQDLISELKAFYTALDKQFDAAGIRPKALKIITKPGTAPVTTTLNSSANNNLDSLRNALAGQQAGPQGTPTSAMPPGVDAGWVLAQLRDWVLSHAREQRENPLALLSSDTFRLLAPDTATSVEMIERIFERLAADASLPEAVRSILQRLRVPLIDRALEGEDLFCGPGQSVQKLIDGVGAIADTVPMDADASHPAIRTLEGIFAELLASGSLHHASLVRAAGAVGAFLDRRNAAAHSRLDDAEPLATKAERREAARLLASRALHVLLGDVKSSNAMAFLSRHWIHVLVNTLYRKGDKHPDWRTNLGIANEISLLGDKPAAQDLTTRVESALRSAGLDETSVQSAMDCLTSALSPSESAASPIEAAKAELSVSVARDNDALLMVHHRGLADTSTRTDSDTMPTVGTWVDLKLPSGTAITGRVQWVGSLRNAGLICEPDQGRCAIVTRRAIDTLESQGDYRIRGGATLLERATKAALEQLGR